MAGSVDILTDIILSAKQFRWYMGVSFEIKDAIKAIEGKKENTDLIRQYNGYLSSAYSNFTDELKEWFVSYYSVEKKEVLIFKANEDGASFDSFSKLQRDGPGGHLDIKKVKIPAAKALGIAVKKNKSSAEKTLIMLDDADKCAWVVNFFTKSLDLISLKIDAKNGKVLKEMKSSLIIGYSK